MSSTAELLDAFSYMGRSIPYRMYTGIVNYVDEHVLPGDFLQSIITNDLKNAVFYADDDNMWLIPVYVAFFYNNTPASCQGSREKMAAWLEMRHMVA